MITVHFPKYIQNLTNGIESQQFDTNSFGTLVNGLRTLFPSLSTYIANIDSQHIPNVLYFMDKDTRKILNISYNKKIESSNLVLLITIQGEAAAGIGAALLAAGFAIGPSTAIFAGLTGASLISMGMGLVLSSVLSLIGGNRNTSSPASPTDAAVRANNDAFEGLKNTTSTDMAVPLIYGQHRVGGQFIDGKIKTINHDKDTIVKVASYV